MSEQECEEWAARLARIWAPGRTVDWFRSTDEMDDASFEFRAMMSADVCFTCRDSRSLFSGLLFRLNPHPSEMTTSSMFCFFEKGSVQEVLRPGAIKADFERFVAQWKDIFRRNCYLSGCPIEASAHEQLEWMLWLQEQEGAYSESGQITH